MFTLESETETMTDNEIVLIDDADLEMTCVICSAEFLDKSDLRIHMSEMHSKEHNRVDNSLKKCNFCDDFFPSSDDYVYHLRNVHLQDLSICEYCSRVFINNYTQKRHSIKHNNLTTKFKYSCSQCKSCFTNIHELELHEMDHGDCDGGFYLNSYFPLLSSIINIKVDRFIRSYDKGEEYICSICKFSSTVVSEYIQHLRISNCRSLVCDKCSNVYTNKKQLRKHLKYYDTTDNCIRKRCQQCGLVMYRMNIREHKKTCAAIKCLTCNINFTTIDELTKHQSEKHPLAVSLLSCKFCRKEFIGTVALTRHMHKKHVGEEHLYKYICVYCRFVYKHPKDLFIHFYTGHSDLQPYTCKICTLQYRTRKAFTLHIKMVHNSVGFVEFDRNYEVFFTDKKSDNPFTPQPIYEPILGDKATKTNSKVEERNETLDADKASECVNVDYLDFMSATENEGNGLEKDKIESNANNTKCTEKDTETATDTEKQKVAKKRKRVTKKKRKETTDTENSEDEPLILVKKRMKTIKSEKLRYASWNKKKINVPRPARKEFTCKHCKKYCYTYQNYNHHMTLHKKRSKKQCTKCEQKFQTSEELIKHTNDAHSSSLLTETLKTIKERKRLLKARQENITSKFMNTIKKFTQEMSYAEATITPVTKGMSVKKFIENFTPDGGDNQKRVIVKGSLSIKKVIGQTFKPKIRLQKFKESVTLDSRPKLKMPQKFLQETNGDEQKATISLANCKVTNKMTFESKVKQDFCDDDDYGMDNASIPDVAEEVLLQEEHDEDNKITPNERNTQVIIPKVSAACKGIKIAHLSDEAPFYKIVKLEDLLKEQQTGREKVVVDEKPVEDTFTLSNGIKLVNVNPLAHLIGDSLEKKPPKRYKPKPFDYKKALAEALTRLDSPDHPKLKRNKGKD